MGISPYAFAYLKVIFAFIPQCTRVGPGILDIIVKNFISVLLSFLILQTQYYGIAVSAQTLGGSHAPVVITPLTGGVEIITRKGARIVRKVRRVRYRSSASSGKHSVRRYHVVRHTRSYKPDPNRKRLGNKVITKAASQSKAVHCPSIELPRDIVTPLIIKGVDNLEAGKRYVEIVERDGKLYIKEGGEIDPNGNFLEVEEEDGVWKIKGTDIVVDFKNTFDVSKVPEGVRQYLNPSTDFVSPKGNYAQYEQGSGPDVVPIQEDTIPPLVVPGDYVEIYQVPVGTGIEQIPAASDTISVPVQDVQYTEGATLAPGETNLASVPGNAAGGPGVPVETVPAGSVSTAPGVPAAAVGMPVETVPGLPVMTVGVPGKEVPVSAIGVPGVPMTVVPVGTPARAAAVPVPPAPVVAAVPPAGPPAVDPAPPLVVPPSPPAALAPAAPALTTPGFPMALPPEGGGVTPFSPIGAVPPPAAGSGFRFPFAGILPALLGVGALGGLLPLAFIGRGGGSGGGGYYPFPVGGGSPTVTGSTGGLTLSPVPSAPYTPGVPPAPTCPTPIPGCPTPPPACPPTSWCPTPAPCPPAPCPPTGGWCPPMPTPPICTLPPICPTPFPPYGGGWGGCDFGFGYGCGLDYGYGCDWGGGYDYGCDYGYGSGYGCDIGYGYGSGYGSGYGCDTGYGSGYGGGYGNPCMGNASKFGFCPPDSTATSYKERWWSQAGRSYNYNGPCAAQSSSCPSGSNCAPSRSTAMNCPPPY